MKLVGRNRDELAVRPQPEELERDPNRPDFLFNGFCSTKIVRNAVPKFGDEDRSLLEIAVLR